jgi:hypothetical protein
MKPGRGARAAMNAASAFIGGLLFFALAAYGNTLDAPAMVIWVFAVIGLVLAVPVAWFQLFD